MKLIPCLMTILILPSSAVSQTPKQISCNARSCNGTLLEVFDAIRTEMEKPAPRLANIFSPPLQQKLRHGGEIETSIRTQDAYIIHGIEVRPFTLGRHGMVYLRLSSRDEGRCLERDSVKKYYKFTNKHIFIDTADPPPPQGWGIRKSIRQRLSTLVFLTGRPTVRTGYLFTWASSTHVCIFRCIVPHSLR